MIIHHTGLALLIAAPLVFTGADAFAAEHAERSDHHFAREAAAGDLAEIQEAQLALQKANNAEVKNYANKIIADHTQAKNELEQIAQSQNIKLPSEPNAKERH